MAQCDTPRRLDGGEIFLRTLSGEASGVIFAIPDYSYNPIFAKAEQYGFRIVGPRHESAGVHMADGWARATGTVGVAMAGLGPGVANMVPGVVTAWIEGIPVLIVATQRTARAHLAIRRGRFQHTPQIEIFRPVTKWAGAVPSAKRIPEYVREAFRHALAGRPGPVYLEIADEILRETVAEDEVQIVPPQSYRVSSSSCDPRLVEKAARMLAQARLPLLYAGGGVLRARAWAELLAVAEHLGCPVVTSAGARGVVPEDHRQCIPPLSPATDEAMRSADLVLAVGTQVGELQHYGQPPTWGPPRTQRWIHIDTDPTVIGVNRPVDLAVVGDAKAVLADLLEALEKESPPLGVRSETSRLVQADRSLRASLAELASSPADPIHPALLIRQVREFFPRDAIACFDGGNTALWAHTFHPIYAPGRLFWTSKFGHLGTGLPYAIAAKLANPSTPVYLITGDSAFGFNIQELETAARERANVVVIINCDFMWGMELPSQIIELGGTDKQIGVRTSEVRYDRIAEGFGCAGFFVDRPEAIRPTLERACQADRPAVIQVRVDPLANCSHPWLETFAAMYAALDT